MLGTSKEYYLYRVVTRLIRDERLKNVDGKIIPFHRCAYRDGKEIAQFGYNFSFTLKAYNSLNTSTNGITFWTEEDNEFISLVIHIGKQKTYKFDKDETNKIVNKIVEMIIGESIENFIGEMVV
ncbi:MAG: hypothetical protein Q8936_22520 [Bacillota bacterium]|nr:hypothetical protein [Bacillota bacterium]